jgi:hypothetical protein
MATVEHRVSEYTEFFPQLDLQVRTLSATRFECKDIFATVRLRLDLLMEYAEEPVMRETVSRCFTPETG